MIDEAAITAAQNECDRDPTNEMALRRLIRLLKPTGNETAIDHCRKRLARVAGALKEQSEP